MNAFEAVLKDMTYHDLCILEHKFNGSYYDFNALKLLKLHNLVKKYEQQIINTVCLILDIEGDINLIKYDEKCISKNGSKFYDQSTEVTRLHVRELIQKQVWKHKTFIIYLGPEDKYKDVKEALSKISSKKLTGKFIEVNVKLLIDIYVEKDRLNFMKID